ncbi:hypothetical protein [Nocardia pseudovaccinii]|uniref:hypothetical protein n=1 Tax=Nocardia pseudovaccinii TaxID=189540 RepID=UPI0007A3D995|nr:hypothetical protein [Nocardia pseudovaccinii]
MATAVPLFAGGPAAADSTGLEWPVIGDIATGSAAVDATGTGSAAADSGSSAYGGILNLEPRGVATGSAAPGTAMSGNAKRGGAATGTGGIDNGADDPPFGGHADATAGVGESLGLDPGSVQSACTGSAVIGSATILLGLATGSGVTGSGVTGSGVTGSGLIGTGSVGSSGSGLGSVVVGSATTGSALLTCLLLLPAPEPPGIPLQLGPPPPAPAIPAPAALIAPPEFPPAAPALAIAPETPIRTTPHRSPAVAAESAPEEPIAWNMLELVTVMVVTVLTVVRKIAVGRNRRAE